MSNEPRPVRLEHVTDGTVHRHGTLHFGDGTVRHIAVSPEAFANLEAALLAQAWVDDDDLWKVAADEWVEQRKQLLAERNLAREIARKNVQHNRNLSLQLARAEAAIDRAQGALDPRHVAWKILEDYYRKADDSMTYRDQEGEIATLRQELADLQALLDAQQPHMQAAVGVWRQEAPLVRAEVHPTLGELLDWLMGRIRLERIRANEAARLSAEARNRADDQDKVIANLREQVETVESDRTAHDAWAVNVCHQHGLEPGGGSMNVVIARYINELIAECNRLGELANTKTVRLALYQGVVNAARECHDSGYDDREVDLLGAALSELP